MTGNTCVGSVSPQWMAKSKGKAIHYYCFCILKCVLSSTHRQKTRVICVLASESSWGWVHRSWGNSWSLSWHRWVPGPGRTGVSSPSGLCPVATGRNTSSVHSPPAETPSTKVHSRLWKVMKSIILLKNISFQLKGSSSCSLIHSAILSCITDPQGFHDKKKFCSNP